MKYNEIIRCIASKPGTPQRMYSFVNSVRPSAKGAERDKVREGIRRVLKELVDCGLVKEIPAPKRGSFAEYIWIDTNTKEE